MTDQPKQGKGRKPRVAIIWDGTAWYIRHIRVIEHDLTRDEKVYRCDKPLGNDYAKLTDVPLVIQAIADRHRTKNNLLVGTTGAGEVIINHPDIDPDKDGVGHIVFSPQQTRNLAYLLLKKANEALMEQQ